MTNHWRTRETDMFLSSIILGLLAGGMAFWLSNFRIFVGIIVFLVAFFVVYDRTRPYHKTMVKVFGASFVDARQIVQNILNEKGLPYSQLDNDQYWVEGEVKIKLIPYQQRGLQGTAVSLTPQNPESQQIIFSLRQKLDEAFRPRGL